MASDETLFLAGDYEAQKMCGEHVRIRPFLQRHFLYSVLISASVNMPVGCYYQSEHTQFLLRRYEALYLPKEAHAPAAELSIGDDRSSFAEDVRIKKSWFPEKYGYTDEESTARLTENLARIQPRIRSGSMRKKLTASISADLSEGSRVREVLGQVLPVQDQGAEFLQPLKKVIEVQEYAMLPTYVEIEMERHGLSTQYGRRRWLEFILFKGYSQSCEEAYRCYCNNPLRIFYDPDFRRIHPYRLDYRDTNLFQSFLDVFPFRGLERAERLSPARLMEIKYSGEFQHYLSLYQALVTLLEEELQAVLLEKRADAESVRGVFREQGRKELEHCRQALLQNTQEAMILYRTLRNPFARSERFRTWAANRTEFPTLQLLSCVKSRRHGILQEYIRELFPLSRVVKRQSETGSRRSIFNFVLTVGSNNETSQTGSGEAAARLPEPADGEKQEASMHNFSISIGRDNHTEQKNIVQAGALPPDGVLTQEAFQAVPAEDLERFRAEIMRSGDLDPDCRQAVLEVLNAKYTASPEEFEKYLDRWRSRKKSFPQKAVQGISTAAGIANIASFILQLLAL